VSDHHRGRAKKGNGGPKVTAIIPARGGSKSVPGKNIRPLGKYPLIAYSVAVARMCESIDEIIVSTDSEEIARTAEAYGAQAPFLRPADISRDDSIDVEHFQFYNDFLTSRGEPVPDFVVHLRPTTPLREVGIVQAAVDAILADPEATSLRSVHPHKVIPHKIFHMDGPYLRGFFPDDTRVEYYNLNRQEYPQTYVPNGYVDVIRPAVIDGHVLHGDRMIGFECDPVPDIDTLVDYESAAQMLTDPRFTDLIHYMEETYD
jgi:CMP-N,N'-diacetyllegionaminic acid synthase